MGQVAGLITVPGGRCGGDQVFLTLSGVGVQVTLEEVMVVMVEDELLPAVQLRVWRAMEGGWQVHHCQIYRRQD